MIAGYCWPQSATGAQSVQLYCHTDARRWHVRVIRQGQKDIEVFSASNLIGNQQSVDGQCATSGCNWTPGLDIEVHPAWPSGFYLVELRTDEGELTHAFFVVRSVQPTPLLLVLSTSTWHAYNTWGGPSYYTGGHVVSPRRPLPSGFLTKSEPHRHRIARFKDWTKEDGRSFAAAGYDIWCMAAGWANWELLFVRWAERQGFNLSYATSLDLHGQPGLLDGTSCYLSVGHDEYWSASMRDQVEAFIDNGGRAAFFSGNTAFWQMRLDHDMTQMTAYKCDIEMDPAFHPESAPDLSTMWSDPLVGRPESHMTGVSFTRGGYANMQSSPAGGGYTVQQSQLWPFAGTGLVDGDTFGEAAMVVGYECDGCELSKHDGRLLATSSLYTPEGFEVLGTAPARLWETSQAPANLADNYVGELNWVAQRLGGADAPEVRARYEQGHAVMGTFRRADGEVFTSGCTDWAYGLEDPQVARITSNVLRRFSA